MAQQIVMPQLGESVVEGKIIEWFVKEGDRVDQGTVLLEVETDKANTEVPSTEVGYVARILQPEGATVDVGTPLIELSDNPINVETSSTPEPAAAAPEPTAAEAPSASQSPGLAQSDDAVTASSVGPPPSRRASSGAYPKTTERSGGDVPWNANNIVAAPTPLASTLPMAQRAAPQSPARSSAGAAAVAAASAPAATYAPPHGPYGAPPKGKYYKPPVVRAEEGDTVVAFSKRRGIISEHMVYSKHVSPHVPCFGEVDVTAAMDLRKKHKARLAEQGVRLSLLAFVLKATCDALREFPSVNAVVGADEVIQRGRVHLGIAVETPGGLLVPVIRDADTLSVAGLARAVDDLATRAREKKITIDDLTGGTFTVTNPGRKGNLFGAAIINQPQVGILRMGEMVRRPVVRKVDGEEVICIRSMMFLGLSYDHRIIDGVAGNGFLYRVRELVEEAKFDI